MGSTVEVEKTGGGGFEKWVETVVNGCLEREAKAETPEERFCIKLQRLVLPIVMEECQRSELDVSSVVQSVIQLSTSILANVVMPRAIDGHRSELALAIAGKIAQDLVVAAQGYEAAYAEAAAETRT